MLCMLSRIFILSRNNIMLSRKYYFKICRVAKELDCEEFYILRSFIYSVMLISAKKLGTRLLICNHNNLFYKSMTYTVGFFIHTYKDFNPWSLGSFLNTFFIHSFISTAKYNYVICFVRHLK